VKRIERLTAKDVWFPEPTASERAKKRLILPRDQRASDTPSSRQLISRAYQDAIFIEAMPTKLRGMMSLFAIGMLAAGGLFIVLATNVVHLVLSVNQTSGWVAFDVALLVLCAVCIPLAFIGGIRALRFDLTAPKENPIVFNRKTRKVYRYTPDIPGLGLLANDKGNFSLWGLLKYIAMTFLPWPGMLLVEYDWDCLEAEYYSQTGPSGNVIRTEEHLDLFVRERPGSDNVIGSFPLTIGFNVGGEALARDLWEHVRRFMEEDGPALSPGDKPAPPPPRTTWQVMGDNPLGRRNVILCIVGTLWTTPEVFYFLVMLIGNRSVPEELYNEALRFQLQRPEMIHWWMLYPLWNKDLAGLVWLGKLLISFPCAIITAWTFFAVLASKLSPAAELPDDLAADAGPRLDLNALAGVSPDLPTQPAV
jgi:hypothetical protein